MCVSRTGVMRRGLELDGLVSIPLLGAEPMRLLHGHLGRCRVRSPLSEHEMGIYKNRLVLLVSTPNFLTLLSPCLHLCKPPPPLPAQLGPGTGQEQDWRSSRLWRTTRMTWRMQRGQRRGVTNRQRWRQRSEHARSVRRQWDHFR